MTKPKYKIIFTDDNTYNGTCSKCNIDQCVGVNKCFNLEKSLTKHRVYFKKVN